MDVLKVFRCVQEFPVRFKTVVHFIVLGFTIRFESHMTPGMTQAAWIPPGTQWSRCWCCGNRATFLHSARILF